jgi:hypothetical protein
MQSLGAQVREPIYIVHLRASRDFLDDRLRAQGQPPIEEAHPGALSRIDAALFPLFTASSAAGTLLSLDAASSLAELAASVRALLERGAPGA